jgi:hypothetical protein
MVIFSDIEPDDGQGISIFDGPALNPTVVEFWITSSCMTVVARWRADTEIPGNIMVRLATCIVPG